MFFSFTTSLAQSHSSFHFKVPSKGFLWYILMYGSACTQPFQGGKEKYMFSQLHTSQMRAAAPFIHVYLNFCKTGPDIKKGIMPVFFFSFSFSQSDIRCGVGRHCYAPLLIFWHKDVCALHSGCRTIKGEHKQMNESKGEVKTRAPSFSYRAGQWLCLRLLR